MLDIFKTKEIDKKTIELSIKSNNDLVDEIHETFYTEVDRLLKEANIKHSLETVNQERIDKANRLKTLGFNNAKDIQETKEEVSKLAKLRIDNEFKLKLADTISYFSQHYPQYKFITEQSVKKICNKYGLIYGQVGLYKGDVPEDNLKQIENLHIKDKDSVFLEETMFKSSWGGPDKKEVGYSSYNTGKKTSHASSYYYRTYKKASLEIAAPMKDFNTDNMKLEGFKLTKIVPPDPIVLKPVFHNGMKHYLIITAWGKETSDELVVNEKMN